MDYLCSECSVQLSKFEIELLSFLIFAHPPVLGNCSSKMECFSKHIEREAWFQSQVWEALIAK